MNNAAINLYLWHRRYTEALIVQYLVAIEHAQEQEDERFAATAKRKQRAVLKLPALAARRAVKQLRNARALVVEVLGSFDLKTAIPAEVRNAVRLALRDWQVEFTAEIDAFISDGFEQGRNWILDLLSTPRLRPGVSGLILFIQLAALMATRPTLSAQSAHA